MWEAVLTFHIFIAYGKAFDDFLALAIRTGQPISRELFQQHPAEMVDAGRLDHQCSLVGRA